MRFLSANITKSSPMTTPLFSAEEAGWLEDRAFERVLLEVLVRKSDLCDFHKIQLRGRLDAVEDSAQLGVATPGLVFDRITAVNYGATGDVRFKTVRFPNAFASLADIARQQKPQDSTEAMYFIQVYHAFNSKLLQMERDVGTIGPNAVMGPISLNLWHVIGGSRFTVAQFAAKRSMENLVRLCTTRSRFLSNEPAHRDFVPQCSCPDGPGGPVAAAGGDFDEIIVQAVKRGLDDEIWDAVLRQRRRGAVPASLSFVGLPVQEFLNLYNGEGAQRALADVAERLVAPPPYPGHRFGPQPGEVREISPQVSSRHVDREFLLTLLQSLLV